MGARPARHRDAAGTGRVAGDRAVVSWRSPRAQSGSVIPVRAAAALRRSPPRPLAPRPQPSGAAENRRTGRVVAPKRICAPGTGPEPDNDPDGRVFPPDAANPWGRIPFVLTSNIAKLYRFSGRAIGRRGRNTRSQHHGPARSVRDDLGRQIGGQRGRRVVVGGAPAHQPSHPPTKRASGAGDVSKPTVEAQFVSLPMAKADVEHAVGGGHGARLSAAVGAGADDVPS